MRNATNLVLFSLLIVGCEQPAVDADCADSLCDTADLIDTADTGEVEQVPFALSSSAFTEGELIPLRYECGGAVIEGPGDNITPELSWTPGPEGTQSYAMVMDDVDSGVVHWVVYDIPADALGLPEDVPSGFELADPAGARQAELQGSGYFGYLGPCSQWSTNTYRFTLHAIGSDALPGATRQTSEYDMVPLIEAASLAAVSLSGES
jgi:Raf kinase inhibitor-like YbhB/YbcL family protein